MTVRENFNEALGSLWASKQRSLLALLGIVIGIGSVIAMVTVGEIVKNEVMHQFTAMGTDILRVTSESNDPVHHASIPLSAAQNVPAHCPLIAAAAPFTTESVELGFKGKTVYLPVLGVTENFADLNKLEITKGRFISDLDILMPFCVLSQKALDKFAKLGMTDPIGKTLLYKGKALTICGVIGDVAVGGLRPYSASSGIFVPISLSFRMMAEPRLNSVMARLQSGTGWERGAAQLKAYFQRTADHLEVKVRSAEQLIQQAAKQMHLFTLLLGAIGSISLVVGGVGVMNVMLVSVAERRKEIGVRRALGAKQRDIQGQFLAESILLCVTGGILGSLIGICVVYIISRLNKWHFLVSWEALLFGVGVSCMVGLFFGFYPARQAARMSPIEALRSD